jgi:hypothetical protein
MQVVWRIPGSQSRGILCFCYGKNAGKLYKSCIFYGEWRTFGAVILLNCRLKGLLLVLLFWLEEVFFLRNIGGR